MKSIKSIPLAILMLCTFILNFELYAQLDSESNQADYIIITPAEFADVIQPFAKWRQDKGLNVLVVQLSQIYSEFPDSTEQSSIRDFVSYSLTNWSDPKPRYLLLVGGGRFIPSYVVPSYFARYPQYHEDSVSIDEWYGVNIYEDDLDPDIAIGRFPVNDEHELNNIIQKTRRFEDAYVLDDYQTDFLFLADKQDSLMFQHEVNRFIDRSVPAEYSVQTIFAGKDSTIEQTRQNLFSALNNDILFFCYYGHGAPTLFSRYGIFSYGDIDSINKNSKPFILTSAACSQPFASPNDSTLVRKLIVKSGSGTVASVNSTGLNYLNNGSEFLSTFYDFYFDTTDVTIGQLVLSTKLQVSPGFVGFDMDGIPRRYTLLGDPALKLPFHTITQIVSTQGRMPESYHLYQNYPNPFNPSTTIKYELARAGYVKITIFDVMGRVVNNIINSYQSAGHQQVKWHGINAQGQIVSAGVYYYKLETENFRSVKKMVLIK